MDNIKLTKNSLRDQEKRLKQLESYLPTLQLKKRLLQMQVASTRARIEGLRVDFEKKKVAIYEFVELLSYRENGNILNFLELEHVNKSYENIAGVELPIFESIVLKKKDYSLFDTPIWMDSAYLEIKDLIELKQNILVEEEKKRALLDELRDVSIRVNLFEKVLIPRALKNIRKIKIFLGDQELSAIAQAKVAKEKILEKKAV